jgi:hypothetical protein
MKKSVLEIIVWIKEGISGYSTTRNIMVFMGHLVLLE